MHAAIPQLPGILTQAGAPPSKELPPNLHSSRHKVNPPPDPSGLAAAMRLDMRYFARTKRIGILLGIIRLEPNQRPSAPGVEAVAMDSFSEIIRQYIDPTQAELNHILQHFRIREIKKGRFLVRSGQISKDFIFIEKGCLRVFWEKDNSEVTGWFAFEDDFFCELSSFIPQQPSAFGVQAIEDTMILYISQSDMEKLFAETPIFETFIRKFWEQVICHLVANVVSFQTETAELRYEKALKHPKLLQRVPLKYISSYLGITPSSLSRLRRRK
ncbi:MAG: Crp/Fnr family transcriptional regulator [Bacteroidia bacterium]|nr:Crp/Fnr family transcriptional regulator [Bacteroidia bacterium]